MGIELDVRSYEFATFYQDVLQGRFQLFTLQWVGGALVDPDILRRVFHSSQMPPAGFNRGFYGNPEVDRLLDAASAATSDEERRRVYARGAATGGQRRGLHPGLEQDERGRGAALAGRDCTSAPPATCSACAT